MIKTQNLVPYIYYKESRDFQLLGRLYDIIFNYLKLNIDSIDAPELINTSENNFVELSLNTLGFFAKRNYNVEELKALCFTYSEIIKNKGNLTSIETLIKTIFRSIKNKSKYNIILEQTGEFKNRPTIIIKIKNNSSNQQTSLIEEVLDYIIPAGVDYYIENISIENEFLPLSINLNENLGVKKDKGAELSSLNDNENSYVEEVNIPNLNNKYTGTFNTSKDSKITKGSIKTGIVYKEKKKEGN